VSFLVPFWTSKKEHKKNYKTIKAKNAANIREVLFGQAKRNVNQRKSLNVNLL
jgi:hypothetical protein